MNVFKSIKSKIIAYTTLCVLFIGITSNLLIYSYLNNIVLNKISSIDSLNLKNISTQLNTNLSAAYDLVLLAANDLRFSSILQFSELNSTKLKKEGITVQETLTSYLRASFVNKYVSKFALFNTYGLIIQASTSSTGSVNDLNKILFSPIFQNRTTSRFVISNGFFPSIDNPENLCLAFLYPISNTKSSFIDGYLYAEFDLKLITDILDIYKGSTNLIFLNQDEQQLCSEDTPPIDPQMIINRFTSQDFSDLNDYLISSTPIDIIDAELYNVVKLSDLYLEKKNIVLIIISVTLASLCLALILLGIISNSITKPINRLITKIENIAYKDFTFDSQIQNFTGEMGQIGKVVNKMALDIKNLLDETVKITVEKKNYEIAMLQSQVNPHFLYNTLNSIHWMASLQKNTGICNMVTALTNLLKNMSKGFSDKIPLSTEISLLEDYLYIQSIRYIDTFEFINHVPDSLLDCLIIKLTLQPLIENAIFHGIAPKDSLGIITLEASTDGANLFLTISDNGVGMTEEEVTALLYPTRTHSKSSMNGIGVNNVNSRLKLIYGSSYGLTIESSKGNYTKIHISIPLEREDIPHV